MTRSRTCGTGAFQPSSRPTTSQNAMGTERCSGSRSTNARVYIRLDHKLGLHLRGATISFGRHVAPLHTKIINQTAGDQGA